VDEQTYLKGIRGQTATRADEHAIPVQVTVQGDESHPYFGTIDSFDNPRQHMDYDDAKPWRHQGALRGIMDRNPTHNPIATQNAS